MTAHSIRGRRRIAYELGLSERTVSRRAAAGLLDVHYEPTENNNVMVLEDPWQPIGLAARRVVEKLSAGEGDDRARRRDCSPQS